MIDEALHGLQPFEVDHHEATVLQEHKDFVNKCDLRDNGLFQEVISKFDEMHRRCAEYANMNHLFCWPVGQSHFDLTAQEFCDALSSCYKKSLLNFPPCCDGYGAPSSLDHTFCCRKGGLIIQYHNGIHDAIGDLAALVWGWVLSEPVVKDASEDGDQCSHC